MAPIWEQCYQTLVAVASVAQWALGVLFLTPFGWALLAAGAVAELRKASR